ncbi:hypothetical protein NDU88_004688 [Pleurodeles waltl]|uniref:Secreted protein n=1 Tax=Pleurodeles waltl TaxID=8319 RepID=A0AAV7PGS8_PLEWA|nr:hypothetical protein NDU88_004688 [Pleurodeles waltl]
MAGFKLRAWIVARGRRTRPHSLMFRFVLLLSPLVAKVSEPLAPFNGGPRLQRVHCSVAAAILGRGSREFFQNKNKENAEQGQKTQDAYPSFCYAFSTSAALVDALSS